MSATLSAVSSKHAPAAIGPYSQGIAAGGFLFTSGQVALDPETGALVPGGIEEQTRRVLQNLSAVLQAGGASLRNVLRCTVFLKDLKDFAAMNKVYAEFFGDPPPSRSTVQVAALPKDALVEIDAIALR